MNNTTILYNTYEFVKKQLCDELTGHDISHIMRVYALAAEIMKGIQCDELVVKLATLLHDVDDYKITKVNSNDCIRARAFLHTQDLDIKTIEEVCYIINHMSFSKNRDVKYKLSIEGEIVQDADRIDALGAIGIARTFQYGGKNNRPMNESFAHFDDKLIKLYNLLNTDEARKVAKSRHDMLMNFYLQYKIENNIINEFEK